MLLHDLYLFDLRNPYTVFRIKQLERSIADKLASQWMNTINTDRDFCIVNTGGQAYIGWTIIDISKEDFEKEHRGA